MTADGEELEPEQVEENEESLTENNGQMETSEETNRNEEEAEDNHREEGTNHSARGVGELGDYYVYLGGEMIETEDSIIIEGESNLLPGARVIGEVSVGEGQFIADTTEIVQEDGRFDMEIEHHDLDEETEVTVKFLFDDDQDVTMLRHYGERGQNLEGPYVYQHQRERGGRSPRDIYRQAKVTVSFVPGEELAVRQFQAPDWYELPEDYGEPRVWIEVDEINDDQQYFYLHGRSNLIEGSRIEGSYHWNSDETLVRPDGSFNLKIEYEYSEDTPFVIEFNPRRSQWNMVEEAYGKDGQNLVGNLVVTNSSNSYQYIAKEIEVESTEIHVPDHVDLTIEGSEVTMLVPDDLLFDFDEYKLKEDAKQTLDDISETLAMFDDEDIEVQVNGHTDNVGNEAYNMDLSEKRAEEVEEYLLQQGDFKNIDFTTQGYGETKPVASNDDEKGQAKNRRVEIVIKLR
jgi:OmpA-OmpF porin, OOP family